jgi:hypothetical protein
MALNKKSRNETSSSSSSSSDESCVTSVLGIGDVRYLMIEKLTVAELFLVRNVCTNWNKTGKIVLENLHTKWLGDQRWLKGNSGRTAETHAQIQGRINRLQKPGNPQFAQDVSVFLHTHLGCKWSDDLGQMQGILILPGELNAKEVRQLLQFEKQRRTQVKSLPKPSQKKKNSTTSLSSSSSTSASAFSELSGSASRIL